jgi:hypothetical protein
VFLDEQWKSFQESHRFVFTNEKRSSIAHELKPEREPIIQNIGSIFPFENREAACQKLFESLYAMSLISTTSKQTDNAFQRLKKDIAVPVTVGIAGQGKTRFVREGHYKHIDINLSNLSSEQKEFATIMGACLNLRIGKVLRIV